MPAVRNRAESPTKPPSTNRTCHNGSSVTDQAAASPTDADLARRQSETSAWARGQNAAGHKLDPRILAPDTIRHGTDFLRGDRESSNAWSITALLFLEAADLAEAGKIAASHPALHFGATIEVRPWAPPVVPAASPTVAALSR